jgi:gas vesicle protein GvpA/GvpJ/GvpM family
MPQIVHSTNGSTLADILERVLDKGVVIAGDIRIKLVEVELLTVNIRLLISSVDKAREIGIDWWSHNPFLCSSARPELSAGQARELESEMAEVKSRLQRLEQST